MTTKTIRNLAIAADVACWGLLLYFAFHFATCPVA